jgi:hypothetical protein
MEKIGLAAQTMFAELLSRCLDADFDEAYDERGSFLKKRIKGRAYWYHQRKIENKLVSRYVGPVSDKSVSERVEHFADIKSDFAGRREMVRALVAAGLPATDALTGKVVEAMWKASFFRLRGVLVGTVAYQAYAGLLGAKLTSAALQTQDVDFAQFWGISKNVGDSMPPILDVLRGVDPTFREIPNLADPLVATGYRNASRYKVEFLTPNRGSAKFQGRPARMPALGGAGAQPLRHLDFLVHEPERSVLLYGGGVPVTVPRAERYAVHKLIVAAERENQAKARKDIMQAEQLIGILSEQRPLELAEAWEIASAAGPRWRTKLARGRARLGAQGEATLAHAIARGTVSTGVRAARRS